jgi:thiamine biosynthesis lipoprotein ApbE
MQTGKALGTDVDLRLVISDILEAEKYFSELWDQIYDYEKKYSRFVYSSELNNINKNAGQLVRISPEFKLLLEKAKYFSTLTHDLFNPFILPQLHRAGYVYSMADAVDKAIPDYSDRQVVNSSFLEIGSDYVCIPENTAIDLGGIGKGYLADMLGNILDGKVDDYCLSLGGDMIVSGKDENKDWNIDIQSSVDRNENIAECIITEKKAGVATSGLVRIKGDKEQDHLVGLNNKQNIYTMCSVLADDTTTADVMASCILLEGEDYAKDLIRQKVVRAVLLQGGATITPCLLGGGFNLKKYV